MHIHFSYHHVVRDPMIDKTIDSNVLKLEKLLSSFAPDLVRLHGLMEFTAPHRGAVCSLNLRLPTGQVNFRHEGDTPLVALQDCFKHLIAQVKKHKAFVRGDGEWRKPIKKKSSGNGASPSRTSVRAKGKSRVKERQ